MTPTSLPARLRALALGAALLAACSDDPGASLPPCEDTIDNDDDGFVDAEDPSCAVGNNTEHDDPPRDCNDGEDDDGDGLVDLEDPGCEGPLDDDELDNPSPACSDGEDNDGDGKTDYPDDPGCFSELQTSEEDGCGVEGGRCPECADGQDNDGDQLVDYPAESGCTAASDDQEAMPDPAACAGIPFEPLPDSGFVSASLSAGAGSLTSNVCGGAGTEKVYEIYLEAPSVMVATTAFVATTADTVVYARSACGDPTTEEACNDNVDDASRGSTILAALQPGYYYLVVDGATTGSTGSFQLQVDFFPGLGDPCDPGVEDACAPGLVCRTVPPNTTPTCEEPVCSDGRDDDADGKIDFPLDPGCAATDDDTEEDTCPDGVDCPACANGVDDDGDQQIDYPADPDCESAAQLVEGCGIENDPIQVVSAATHSGVTTGLTDDFSGSCFSNTGPDQVWLLDLPVPVDSLTVDTIGSNFDTVLVVRAGNCEGADLACDDQSGGANTSLVTMPDVAAGVYAIVVDGWLGGAGSYQLHVRGEVAVGSACTDPLFAAGVLACPDWAPCDGSICVPGECSDTTDNDGDGASDYPADPGCSAVSDTSEADDCPSGPNCPECANDLDDDGDGVTDYGADPNCDAGSDDAEGCESDPTILVSAPIHTGITTGLGLDFTATCGWGTDTAPDQSFLLRLPVTASVLTIDTVGSSFDTVLSVRTPACDPDTNLYCDDEGGGTGNTSRLTLTGVAAGDYIVVVDGYSGAEGSYALRTSGIVEPGASCTSPLFAAGVLACPGGQTCNGTVCQ